MYGVIVWYITDHLDPTNYLLNFGIIALHELRTKVIITFTLKILETILERVGPNFWKVKPWKLYLKVYMGHLKCINYMFGKNSY